MTADDVTLQVKSANCVTVGANIRPERLVAVASVTAQAGANTTITLAAGASAVDDFYNGFWIRTDDHTGAGQARQILDYAGSTKVATVRQWETNPDNSTDYTIGFVQSQAVNAAGIMTNIGVPVAIDSGTATLAGMLQKLADDNNGATFDATNDSLNKVRAAVGTPVAIDSGTATIAGMLTKLADDNNGGTFDATNDSLNKIQVAATAIKTVTDNVAGMYETDGAVKRFTEGAVADDGVIGVGVNVQDRGEVPVEPGGAQLAADGAGRIERQSGVVASPQDRRGRRAQERGGKQRDATPLLVDTNQERVGGVPVQIRGEGADLLHILQVALEEDDPAHASTEQIADMVRQLGAVESDTQEAQDIRVGHLASRSTRNALR